MAPIGVTPRGATVFFSDIAGYTSISEVVDPEEMKEILSRIFGGTAQIVAKYEGHIDKIIGDAVMVLFGVSVVLAAFAINAVDRANDITKYALNADVEQTMSDLVGTEFGEFIRNPSAPAVGLERTNGDPTGYIRVAINERTGVGYIFAIDLKDGEEFIVQGTAPDGEVIELARITAGNTPVVAQTFSVDVAIAGSLTYRAINTTGEIIWS